MTWVKICGITSLEDARMAVEAGADALGFVFYEKSTRRIPAEAVREITSQLPDNVEKVGVFVNAAPEQVGEIVQQAGLTAVQLCADPVPIGAASDYAKGVKVIVTIPREFLETVTGVYGLDTPRIAGTEPINAFLFDSSSEQQWGGTGKRFDWEEAQPLLWMFSKVCKVVVAGGLDPSNVADAMRLLRPWGVDVSSGVEERPGKKDVDKVRAFIAAVRAADKVSETL